MPQDGFEVADHQRLATGFFNDAWALMVMPSRTAEETDAMIGLAQASRHHWSIAGGAREAAIGHWQCARVYALAGLADSAAYHASRSLEIGEREHLGAFLVGAAHEACARAAATRGDGTARDWHLARARTQAAAIADSEERQVLEADIASVPNGG